MKKVVLLVLTCLVAFNTYAQDQTKETSPYNYKNELRLNALMLFVGSANLAYEGYLKENKTSLGISAEYTFDRDDIDRLYMISPYYRVYLDNRTKGRYFLEVNSPLYAEKTNNGFDEYLNGFGLGFGFGWKRETVNNIILELYGSLGRNFIHTEDINDQFGSIAISIGKRF